MFNSNWNNSKRVDKHIIRCMCIGCANIQTVTIVMLPTTVRCKKCDHFGAVTNIPNFGNPRF